MTTTPSEQYLEKAKRLSKGEIERHLSRARNEWLPRLAGRELSPPETVVIQIEEEDKALNEWRNKWAELRE